MTGRAHFGRGCPESVASWSGYRDRRLANFLKPDLRHLRRQPRESKFGCWGWDGRRSTGKAHYSTGKAH